MILRKVKYVGILAAVFLCLQTSVKAQVKHGYQQWYTYFGGLQLNEKWSIPFDVQVRLRDAISDKGQVLTRAGLQYSINKKASVLLGYAYITTYSDALDAYFPEHRIFQQFIYKTPIKKWDMFHRIRLEQRFAGVKVMHTGGDLKVDDWNYGNRFRYFNRTTVPLKGGPFYFALQDELFMNLWGNDISKKFFDQNRFLTAIGYAFKPNLKVDIGYMNQFVQSPAGNKSMNHILQFSVYQTIAL